MILLLAACSAPEDQLTWQDGWEVLIANSDGNILDLRFVQGNHGVLKGMGQARGEVARRRESSIRFGFDAYPDEVEHLEAGGIRMGPDYIEKGGDGWQVMLREGSDLEGYRDLRMGIASHGFEMDPVETEGWTTDVVEPFGEVSGALVAGGRHRILRGRAVVIHRFGTSPPSLDGVVRQAVFALAEDISVGVDQTGGDVVAWAILDGEMLRGEPILSRDARSLTADFQPELPLKMRVVERNPRLDEDPYEELSAVERAALDALGKVPNRTLTSGTAEILYRDQLLSAPALTLRVDYE